MIFATNLVDPDALIVRTNPSKPNADFAYLNDDAVVVLRELRGAIPMSHRAEAERLIRTRRAAGRGDWRESNRPRWWLERRESP